MSAPRISVPLDVLIAAHSAMQAVQSAGVSQPIVFESLLRLARATGRLGFYIEAITNEMKVEVSA